MNLRLIRNSTMRLSYGDMEFLLDPFLSSKHTIESFAGASLNPTVDLPCSPEEVVNGIDAVIVSHLHPDHFDQAAADLLPKDTPILCQPIDDRYLRQSGLSGAEAVIDSTKWGGVTIKRTPGRHGSGVWAQKMGNVSGFVFEAPDEPTLYWAGDTILTDEVKQILKDIEPDVIITHSGGAQFLGSGPIIMDGEQTISVCLENPNATIVATHLEALDHCIVSRSQLKALAKNSNISNGRLLVPQDGETMEF